MNEANEIKKMLEAQGVFADMFDIVRLVDAEQGVLMETHQDGTVMQTQVCCTDALGAEDRCRNCTSMRAYFSNETVVKLEYAQGSVLLIFSAPVTIHGRQMVAELIKDITKSMTVNVEEGETKSDEIVQIIGNLNQMATTDALTNLYNRRYFDEKLPNQVDACKKLGEKLYVAMLDLDNFKNVNDFYGHAMGDAALVAVGLILTKHARRGSDWAARYGGEEFFICFPGAKREAINRLMESILWEIGHTPIVLDGQKIYITVSIGLTELYPEDDMITLVARSDQLLYAAKAKGKNRIESSID